MKKNYLITVFIYLSALLFAICILASCKPGNAQLSAAESTQVKDSVTRLAANIAIDVSKIGPAAWLNYFEDSPDFFMANEGQLVFKDYQSAKSFILNTVVKNISVIKLKWDNIRVDALTPAIASIGADFHEDQVTSTGKTLTYDGYFTGIAHFNGHSWKLRNTHWSIKSSK